MLTRIVILNDTNFDQIYLHNMLPKELRKVQWLECPVGDPM